jgi:hypothetical protein
MEASRMNETEQECIMLQNKLDAAIASHQITIAAYTELRERYDTLYRQFTELCNEIEKM